MMFLLVITYFDVVYQFQESSGNFGKTVASIV